MQRRGPVEAKAGDAATTTAPAVEAKAVAAVEEPCGVEGGATAGAASCPEPTGGPSAPDEVAEPKTARGAERDSDDDLVFDSSDSKDEDGSGETPRFEQGHLPHAVPDSRPKRRFEDTERQGAPSKKQTREPAP